MIVEIVCYETGEVVKTLGPCANRRAAERVAEGVDINLSPEYFTRIRESAQQGGEVSDA